MSRKFFSDFEHYKQPLASKRIFAKRMLQCLWFALLLLTIVLLIATVVYHAVESFSWLDSLLNSVTILTGLGLVNVIHSTAGKIFTIFFSIFSAMVFYMVLAIIFSPLIHRFLHKFHLEDHKDRRVKELTKKRISK